MGRAEMNAGLVSAYDLGKDREYVERIQMATVQETEHALRKDHGLLGSGRWWAAVADESIPTRRVEGTITDVRVNSGNWPEFEVEAEGEHSVWALEGELHAYRVGSAVRVDFVELPFLKPQAGGDDTVQVVLRILVEAP